MLRLQLLLSLCSDLLLDVMLLLLVTIDDLCLVERIVHLILILYLIVVIWIIAHVSLLRSFLVLNWLVGHWWGSHLVSTLFRGSSSLFARFGNWIDNLNRCVLKLPIAIATQLAWVDLGAHAHRCHSSLMLGNSEISGLESSLCIPWALAFPCNWRMLGDSRACSSTS